MKHEARRQLVRMIEDAAWHDTMKLTDACRQVLDDPNNFALVVTACGAHWKGRNPSLATVRQWCNTYRQRTEPYLPFSKRPKHRASNSRRAEEALRLLNHGRSRESVAREMGISLATLYRWAPAYKVKTP